MRVHCLLIFLITTINVKAQVSADEAIKKTIGNFF